MDKKLVLPATAMSQIWNWYRLQYALPVLNCYDSSTREHHTLQFELDIKNHKFAYVNFKLQVSENADNFPVTAEA